MKSEKNKKESINEGVKKNALNEEIDMERWYTPEEVEVLLIRRWDKISIENNQQNVGKS